MPEIMEVGHCKDCCENMNSLGFEKCIPNHPLIEHLAKKRCPFCKPDFKWVGNPSSGAILELTTVDALPMPIYEESGPTYFKAVNIDIRDEIILTGEGKGYTCIRDFEKEIQLRKGDILIKFKLRMNGIWDARKITKFKLVGLIDWSDIYD